MTDPQPHELSAADVQSALLIMGMSTVDGRPVGPPDAGLLYLLGMLLGVVELELAHRAEAAEDIVEVGHGYVHAMLAVAHTAVEDGQEEEPASPARLLWSETIRHRLHRTMLEVHHSGGAQGRLHSDPVGLALAIADNVLALVNRPDPTLPEVAPAIGNAYTDLGHLATALRNLRNHYGQRFGLTDLDLHGN